ncbi:MAG: hypothetical protein ACRD2T_04275, partial [Thermoanaerobaculia bacterium]
MNQDRNRRRRRTSPSLFLLLLSLASGLAASLRAEDPPPVRIASIAELGLSRADAPVSTETKVVYLVNPVLNRTADLEAMLRSGAAGDAASAGRFTEEEVKALCAPSRPGNTVAYDAVADAAEEFFKQMFLQPPDTERSLHRVVQEENRAVFPLIAFDAVPRLAAPPGSRERAVETRVSLRLFIIQAEADRQRDLRWVTRCELLYEDTALGRAALGSRTDPARALAASVNDALRGKLAPSFALSPVLRRDTGRIDEPRLDLLGR